MRLEYIYKPRIQATHPRDLTHSMRLIGRTGKSNIRANLIKLFQECMQSIENPFLKLINIKTAIDEFNIYFEITLLKK